MMHLNWPCQLMSYLDLVCGHAARFVLLVLHSDSRPGFQSSDGRRRTGQERPSGRLWPLSSPSWASQPAPQPQAPACLVTLEGCPANLSCPERVSHNPAILPLA